MGMLNDQIAGDAVASFMDADGFAEAVIYTPKGGTPRTINAIVRRETPESQMGSAQDVQPRLLVIVANDPVLGIASNQVNYGGDTITLARRIGQTPSSLTIKMAKGQETNDPGCLSLEL